MEFTLADVVLSGLEAGTAGPSPPAGVLAANLSGFRGGLQSSPPVTLACMFLSPKSWGLPVPTWLSRFFLFFPNTSLTASHGEFPFQAGFDSLR